MNKEAWRLTDEEVDKYMKKGFGVAMEAQKAKRQAFEDGGGVILNPQALEVLYEALKESEILHYYLKEHYPDLEYPDTLRDGADSCGRRRLALAKAEEE